MAEPTLPIVERLLAADKTHRAIQMLTADETTLLSQSSDTITTLVEALEYIERQTGKGPDGFIDWQRCVDRIQSVARAALTKARSA